MTITYTRNIPDPPHNPSQDVGSMQQNTNAIDDIIDVDHFSFNDTVFSGLHKQSTYVNETTPATAPGQLAVFSKGGPAGPSQLFLVRDNNAGTEVALTPNPSVIGNILSAQNGYSWLPGSILIQWGFNAIGANANTVVPFNVPYGVAWLPITILTLSGNFADLDVSVIARTNANFTVHNASNSISVFWISVGPI